MLSLLHKHKPFSNRIFFGVKLTPNQSESFSNSLCLNAYCIKTKSQFRFPQRYFCFFSFRIQSKKKLVFLSKFEERNIKRMIWIRDLTETRYQQFVICDKIKPEVKNFDDQHDKSEFVQARFIFRANVIFCRFKKNTLIQINEFDRYI